MSKPVYFYKFVPFDRKDILENGLIRFAPIGNFNDPFELEPTITPLSRNYLNHIKKMSDKEVQKIKLTEDDIDYSISRMDEIDTYRKKYKEEVEKYGVLSLSSNMRINPLLSVSMPEKNDPRTNILIWSHYSNNHKGFVIEFRADFIEEISIEEVEYSNEREVLTFEDIEINNFNKVFFKKSIEWKYEQEYRAILPLEKCTKIVQGDIHLFEIKKSRINSICFGCAMSEDEKTVIKNIIEQDSELNSVVLYHAYLSETGYFLKFYSEHRGWTNNPEFRGTTIPMQQRI